MLCRVEGEKHSLCSPPLPTLGATLSRNREGEMALPSLVVRGIRQVEQGLRGIQQQGLLN